MPMLSKELQELAEPVLAKVREHPFWAGLRDGSLPPESLAYFVEQDTGWLLPGYARALARTAAATRWDAHASLLARSVIGALEARDRLRAAYAELAPRLELPAAAESPEITAPTHAHCSFFHAATAATVAAGMGALLPMVWFNHQISDDLLRRHVPGSRYAEWIKVYHPGEGYQYAVKGFMAAYDELGERMAVPGRAELLEYFTTSIRYEWAFAEAAWSRSGWPL
ncbi:TenA family protein [Streptomyces turgidiscabies]|uniref:Thiaminase/transcriptional activator TenA n=1 Tax=Streptomyces turgidiscabies TaxID=85558 RepID=A0ABU0RZ46_9ACTN|nr:TenA family transcriptional regulator [Streptomyces turgidiscabies]MDQ0937220.1 thiaminase/transcriptional activator TenA [Streptomyces turgidiscabies]